MSGVPLRASCSGKAQHCPSVTLQQILSALSVSQALETDDQENEVVLRKIQERMQRYHPSAPWLMASACRRACMCPAQPQACSQRKQAHS